MSARVREPGVVTLVERLFAKLQQSGFDGLLSNYSDFFSEAMVWRPVLIQTIEGEESHYVGLEGMAQYAKDFGETFDGLEWGLSSIESVGGGQVLVQGTVHGRGARSGVPIDREVAYVFDVSDGLIRSARSFFTADEAKEFLTNA